MKLATTWKRDDTLAPPLRSFVHASLSLSLSSFVLSDSPLLSLSLFIWCSLNPRPRSTSLSLGAVFHCVPFPPFSPFNQRTTHENHARQRGQQVEETDRWPGDIFMMSTTILKAGQWPRSFSYVRPCSPRHSCPFAHVFHILELLPAGSKTFLEGGIDRESLE